MGTVEVVVNGCWVLDAGSWSLPHALPPWSISATISSKSGKRSEHPATEGTTEESSCRYTLYLARLCM